MLFLKRKDVIQSDRFVYGLVQDEQGDTYKAIVLKVNLTKSGVFRRDTGPLVTFRDDSEPPASWVEAMLHTLDYMDDPASHLKDQTQFQRMNTVRNEMNKLRLDPLKALQNFGESIEVMRKASEEGGVD